MADNKTDVAKVAPANAGQTMSPPPVAPRTLVQGGGSWGAMPTMNAGMTFKEIGSSGLRAWSGWVREEFLPELTGLQGARVYREMMDNNASVGGIMFSVISTMRKVEWRVSPPKNGPENQEMLDFVESLKDDMSHTWEELITENLSMLAYGFAPHEIVYKRRLGMDPGPDPDRPGHDLPRSRYDDGKIGWRRIPLRGQDTVIKWFFDENGMTKGMTQQPWIGPLIDIPIEKMLLFRPSHFKGNPEGRSILRSAWRSYFLTKRIEEQEAIMFERFNGLPVVRVPLQLIEAANAGDSGSSASMQMWRKIATNIRVDEQMGVVMPSDTFKGADGNPTSERQYDLQFITPENKGTANSKEILDRYAVAIMTSVLADFLHLGHTARGTQALADQKVDMFYQAVEGFLNANASVYNKHGLPRIWELNGMDHDTMPTIEPDLATRVDLDVLSNFVLRLSQSGMPMFPNDELQSYLMDAAGMPDATDPGALEFAGMTEELIGAKTDETLNPPEPVVMKPGMPPPKPMTKLEKILAASLARRIIRNSGSRFDVSTTKKHRHKRHPTRAERIAKVEAVRKGNGHAEN